MSNHIKYPRTPHLPLSYSTSKDDLYLENASHFWGKEVVVTLKMDGECLDENTIIETDKGKLTIKYICENKIKCNVLSYDLNGNKYVFKPIIEYFINNKEKQWIEILLENNEKLLVTSDHLVWLPLLNCYRRADQIEDGDEILFSKP